MKFKDGFCAVNGAFVDGKDDFEDSPHLAGILALFDHPQQVDCSQYVVNVGGPPPYGPTLKYIRCPDSKYDVSRDQAILLMAGLWKQNRADLVDTSFIDGKDIIPPSVQGMVRIIHGKKPYFWQRWDFEAELKVNTTIQKLEEPFQVIAMCMVYGENYLRRWTEKNNLWKWAIRRYLSELDGAWRGEKELAEFIIQKIESMIK